MSWEAARVSIYGALLTAWETEYPTYTVFVPGQGEPDLTTRKTPFLTVKIQPQRTVQSAMLGATPPKRRFGTLELDFYVPERTGDNVILTAMGILEGLFTATTIDGIVFQRTMMPSASTAVGWTSQGFYASFYFD